MFCQNTLLFNTDMQEALSQYSNTAVIMWAPLVVKNCWRFKYPGSIPEAGESQLADVQRKDSNSTAADRQDAVETVRMLEYVCTSHIAQSHVCVPNSKR